MSEVAASPNAKATKVPGLFLQVLHEEGSVLLALPPCTAHSTQREPGRVGMGGVGRTEVPAPWVSCSCLFIPLFQAGAGGFSIGGFLRSWVS